MAVAAEDLIELLLVDHRELLLRDRGRSMQAFEADLAGDTLERHLAGRDALKQDHRQLPAERGELIALSGGLATLLVHAAASAAIAQAQQLAKQVEQPIATLDRQRLQQHQHY
jgi:hypothetical protein